MRSAKLAIGIFFFVYAAFGQTGGTLTGVISDPGGAVVPNAPVQARHTESGVVYQGATSATGNYTFSELPAGTYEIEASVPGFKKYIRTGITVQQLQTTRVDVELEIGQAAEAVTVNEDAPLLKTESGDISHNVTTTTQDDLPIGQIGGIRVSTEVVATIPGVNGIQGVNLGFTGIAINGSPAGSERIRIDGLDATYTLGNVYYSFGAPSVDSLQEVAIQTSNYAAEYGQSSGAVLSYTMRSGTNRFHGSLYEYLVNEDLNAHGSYSHLRPKSRSNDYGGTVGGPVWIPKIYNGKDKTFFFFSFETHPTTTTTSTNYLTVPTPQYQMGNFSAATAAVGNKVLGTDPLGNPIIQNAIYDPATQMLAPNGQLVRTAFPNNTIPLNRLDPVALRVQALIPQPQGPFAANLINNYVNPYTVHMQDHIPSIKVDHSVNSKIKLSYNWGEVFIRTPGPPTNPTIDGFPTLLSNFLTTYWVTTSNRLNYDQTLKPTLLLHLGGAFVKSSLSAPAAVTGYDPTASLALKGPFTPLEFPAFTGLLGANSTGGAGNPVTTGLGVAGGIDGQQLSLEEKTNFIANLTWVKNNHTYKFGSEASIEGYPNYNVINTDGVFGFSAAETGLPYLANGSTVGGNSVGLPYASFLLGLVDNYNVSAPAVGKLGKHQLGFYAQDSWKITRKLTLDYGLRYDVSTASVEEHGRFGTFDPTVPNTGDGGRLGGVTYGATCHCTFAPTYPYGFGPRLGVAYQLNSKTVLRGGAALLYNGTPDTGITARNILSNNQNFSPAIGQPAMTLAAGIPLTYSQIAFPNFDPSHYPVVATPGLPGAPVLQWIDKNAGRPSRSYQWSVGVQREIVRNLVAEAAFVGNRGMWWPTAGGVNYNANTPQALLVDGLDITQASARTILTSPIGSAAAGPFQNKLPYSNFPLTATVAQALRPYPQFSTAPPPLWAPLGDNWYDSLQVKVTKRFSRGLSATYAFTWSKTLQNGIEGTENDPFNRSQDKYLSSADRPLVSNINFTYIVPAPSFSRNRIVSSVLRDWQMGALLIYSSGTPIAVPAAQTLLNSYTFETASYFNRVPGQPLFLQDLNCHCFDPTKTLVLNPAAWTDPAPGTWGTSPAYYSDYRAQRHPTENFNVGRTFRFRESMNLSVRAEFINIFNRTVFPAPSSSNPLATTTCFLSGVAGPTGACSASTGGYASGFGFMTTTGAALTPRTGQIVARFVF
ncbi:MAG: TonB-dependent receptor [Bryobacterales bacterium]|nr:TonB-dependent receptor [Bryobacterales bacterium]